MTINDEHRPGDGLRRLHNKMALKHSWMVTDLGGEWLRFDQGRRGIRMLPMRKGVDPRSRPVGRDFNHHCGVEDRERNDRQSFDMGMLGCHRSALMIAKTAGLRQQKYPEGASIRPAVIDVGGRQALQER